jgi:hypothetical protein
MAHQQAAKVQPTIINGLDLQAAMDTIAALKANPELARFRFRASNSWIDGGHNRSTIQGF